MSECLHAPIRSTEHVNMTERPTYGQWRPGIDAAERRARLRSLRALAGVIAGPRADALYGLLLAAGTDDIGLDLAADALEDLAPLDLRRVLANYAARAAPPPAFVKPRSQLRSRIMGQTVAATHFQPLAMTAKSSILGP